jgi:hypothetical protein
MPAAVRTYITGDVSQPHLVAIIDFNNDCRPDIAVTHSSTKNIFWLYGHGNGTFENKISYPFGGGHHPH